MARNQLNEISTDLQSDSGSVLWSFIRGEQLEFPVTLNFLTNASAGYVYEAVIVEALNIANSTDIPTNIRTSGVQSVLIVRVPTDRGTWSAGNSYNREEFVLYSGTYYKLSAGAARINATIPSSDPVWEIYIPNKIYIQFSASLTVSPAYTVIPSANIPVYGFFELRVMEPSGVVYQRTWKPIRGVVEFLFSPTELVA